jgi:subtilisin family serine protease
VGGLCGPAITSGATDINDVFAGFSNFGNCVDVNAPGVGITSTWNTSNTATAVLSGTSMSSPHTAGVAALFLAGNLTATPAQVKTAIANGATPGVLFGVPPGTPNLLLYSLINSCPGP